MTIASNTRLTELTGQTRQPAVAGYFYPADAATLRQNIRDLLARVSMIADPPKALIAPHAGYSYSGPIAATAYASLTSIRHKIRRVVLLGPAHRQFVRGAAVPTDEYFATPLGRIRIDGKLRTRISGLKQVEINDAAFRNEHSLEVHLPFLQTVLEDFSLLPILVGDASADEIAQLLQEVWGGDETLIVVSSDLSHYHDYATACRLDNETSLAIRDLQYTRIGPANACGCRPLHGLLQLSGDKNFTVEILDLRNSGDTAGARDRVVGYGAYALYPPTAIRRHHEPLLMTITSTSIRQGLTTGRPTLPDLSSLPPSFTTPAAVFVTLQIDNNLRGCIGNTEPVSPLATAVATNSWNAAFRDPRFPPLSAAEYERIDIGISVLSEKSPLQFDSEQALLDQLIPGSSGLVIARGSCRAIFLPSVWENITEPQEFLSRLKQKAGIGRDEMVEQAWTYTTRSFYGRPD